MDMPRDWLPHWGIAYGTVVGRRPGQSDLVRTAREHQDEGRLASLSVRLFVAAVQGPAPPDRTDGLVLSRPLAGGTRVRQDRQQAGRRPPDAVQDSQASRPPQK